MMSGLVNQWEAVAGTVSLHKPVFFFIIHFLPSNKSLSTWLILCRLVVYSVGTFYLSSSNVGYNSRCSDTDTELIGMTLK